MISSFCCYALGFSDPVLVEAEPKVSTRLELLFTSPAERHERLAFLEHWLDCVRLEATALVQATRELSEPSQTDKDSPVASRWSLASLRRMLNLVLDSSFALTLAQADLQKPQLAQFIHQTASQFR